MELTAALAGVIASAVLWLGGGAVNERVRAAAAADLPPEWRALLTAEAPYVLAGPQPLREWLRHDWRAILTWMLPIAVAVGILEAARFPTIVPLATLAAYALYSTAAEWAASTAETDRLMREAGLAKVPRRRFARGRYLLSLAASNVGFFLLPAEVAVAILGT